MDDRSVQFPQRYRLQKVDGTDDIFDLIPVPGEIQNEGTPINKATLWKDVTAAMFGLGPDSVPDDVLAMLSKSVLFDRVSTRTPEKLQTLTVGSTIKLNYGGSAKDFIVLKHNYESGLNGTGRTLLAADFSIGSYAWGDSRDTHFTDSALLQKITSVFLPKFDSDISELITAVTVPAYNATGSITTGSYKAFALSVTECGASSSYANVEGTSLGSTALSALSNLTMWTRTRNTGNDTKAFIAISGSSGSFSVSLEDKTSSYEVHPVFTLPGNVDLYKDSFGVYHAEQEYSGETTYPNGDKVVIGPQIATGSYVGTEKYGKDNPNSLTFEFPVKFVVIYASNSSNPISDSVMFSVTFSPDFSFGKTDSISWHSGSSRKAINGIDWSNGNRTLSFYSNRSAEMQLNLSDKTYYYYAFG